MGTAQRAGAATFHGSGHGSPRCSRPEKPRAHGSIVWQQGLAPTPPRCQGHTWQEGRAGSARRWRSPAACSSGRGSRQPTGAALRSRGQVLRLDRAWLTGWPPGMHMTGAANTPGASPSNMAALPAVVWCVALPASLGGAPSQPRPRQSPCPRPLTAPPAGRSRCSSAWQRCGPPPGRAQAARHAWHVGARRRGAGCMQPCSRRWGKWGPGTACQPLVPLPSARPLWPVVRGWCPAGHRGPALVPPPPQLPRHSLAVEHEPLARLAPVPIGPEAVGAHGGRGARAGQVRVLHAMRQEGRRVSAQGASQEPSLGSQGCRRPPSIARTAPARATERFRERFRSTPACAPASPCGRRRPACCAPRA